MLYWFWCFDSCSYTGSQCCTGFLELYWIQVLYWLLLELYLDSRVVLDPVLYWIQVLYWLL
ncbi:unnamed protein product [Staurois parvus]|uniref:Uncharacterized protein n=1 Tax=Staurois parvus TaxID=386267 RepID=A0ABN9DPS0_9NEOB|nr:unnamed protein product [Staurois parvus]